MTLPNSLLSYQDCTELLDRAIEDDNGIRWEVPDYGQAMHQQSRLHYCRKLHRLENARIYDDTHHLYNRSVYDAIVVRIRNIDGQFFLYLERNDKVRGKIESLSELEAPAPTNGEVKRRV